VRQGQRQVEHLGVGVGHEPPGGHRLDPNVADAADVEVVVGHHGLGADTADVGDAAAGQPHRQADVDRALVGADADAGEQPGVRPGVVAVEVVGLAPRRITLDRVGKVVAGLEYRHRRSPCCRPGCIALALSP
jgi:hypothetical protein